MFNNKPRMKKIIGLRNIVTTKDKWSYLLFYDMDNPSEGDIKRIIELFEMFYISYVIYETKHGIHALGLTPIDSYSWGQYFRMLQDSLPEYYSGQTIRLSLKEGEKQSLVFWNLDYPVLSNLLHIYEKRFNYPIPEIPIFTEEKYHLVFEKYWSKKI